MCHPSKNESQKGAGLVEILITSSILLVIFMFLMQTFTNFNRFQSQQKNKLSKLEAKDYVNESADCDKTRALLTDGTCDAGERIEIRKQDDSVLIKVPDESENDYQRLGSLQLYAVCEPCTDEECNESKIIAIKGRKVDADGRPTKHPLTKEDEEFKDMFNPLIPFSCSIAEAEDDGGDDGGDDDDD